MNGTNLTAKNFIDFCDRIKEIKQLVIEGLYCDGGHHKQWYLEQILEKMGYKPEDVVEEGYKWEKGIAP